MDINKANEWAVKIHENAKAHGWWDEERSDGEILALCHSELSEALEEYRNGKPMLYYKCDCKSRICGYACENYFTPSITCEKDYLNEFVGAVMKPEGIAVELADCVIRILDYFGHKKQEIDKIYWDEGFDDYEDIGTFIADMHRNVSTHTYGGYDHNKGKVYMRINSTVTLSLCVCEICKYLKTNNIDLWEIVAIKHEYNKTRPYRHNGKVI